MSPVSDTGPLACHNDAPRTRVRPRYETVASWELWRTVPGGARESVPGGRCPKCAGSRVHRRRTRSAVDVAMRMFTPWRPFKCAGCLWHGWRVPVTSSGPSLELPKVVETPSRRNQRGHRHSKHSLTAVNDLARRRARWRVVSVVVLALMTSMAYTTCQQERSAHVDD